MKLSLSLSLLGLATSISATYDAYSYTSPSLTACPEYQTSAYGICVDKPCPAYAARDANHKCCNKDEISDKGVCCKNPNPAPPPTSCTLDINYNCCTMPSYLDASKTCIGAIQICAIGIPNADGTCPEKPTPNCPSTTKGLQCCLPFTIDASDNCSGSLGACFVDTNGAQCCPPNTLDPTTKTCSGTARTCAIGIPNADGSCPEKPTPKCSLDKNGTPCCSPNSLDVGKVCSVNNTTAVPNCPLDKNGTSCCSTDSHIDPSTNLCITHGIIANTNPNSCPVDKDGAPCCAPNNVLDTTNQCLAHGTASTLCQGTIVNGSCSTAGASQSTSGLEKTAPLSGSTSISVGVAMIVVIGVFVFMN